MIYLLLFLFCFLATLMENTQGTEIIRKPIQVVLILFFILFVGFRMVGPDFESYQSLYNYNSGIETMVEPFFVYTIKFFKSFHLTFSLYTCFIAALSILIKTYVIKEYSPYFFLSVLVGLPLIFLGDMGQIRFSLAVATLMLSIPYCIKRDPIRFAIVLFVATSMHVSSLIFVVAYFLIVLRINYLYMLLIWLGCFAMSYIIDNTNLSDFVDTFANNTLIDIKVTGYTNEENAVYTGRVEYTIPGILFRMITLGLIYYTPVDQEDSAEPEKMKSFLMNIYFFGNCLFFLFSFNEIMSLRTSIYFISFEALLVPFALYFVKDRITFWTLLGIFSIKSFYQFYSMIYLQYPDFYLPYKNVLMRLW